MTKRKTKPQKLLPSEKPRCEHNRLLDGACPDCYADMVKAVADIADSKGIWARDILPRQLPQGLRVTPVVLRHADEYNAQQLTVLIDRYGANIKPSTVEYQDLPQEQTYFGKSVRGLLHWMGQDGWSLSEARRCLDNLDIDFADVKAEMAVGRSLPQTLELPEKVTRKLYQLGGCTK